MCFGAMFVGGRRPGPHRREVSTEEGARSPLTSLAAVAAQAKRARTRAPVAQYGTARAGLVSARAGKPTSLPARSWPPPKYLWAPRVVCDTSEAHPRSDCKCVCACVAVCVCVPWCLCLSGDQTAPAPPPAPTIENEWQRRNKSFIRHKDTHTHTHASKAWSLDSRVWV